MDISGTVQPDSDQLDAIDLQMSGPRTFTITKVSKGKADQPVEISLAEFPRVWRPGKSMRRVLVAAWSPDASTYVGRRVTLYCDPNVRFGSDLVGGTRISNMTDLPGGKRLSISLLISRGKSAMFNVDVLADATPAPTEPTAEQVAASTDSDALRAMWQASGVERRAQIEARVDDLKAAHKTDDAAGRTSVEGVTPPLAAASSEAPEEPWK